MESDKEECSKEGDEVESYSSYEAPQAPCSKALHDPKGKASVAQQPTISGRTTWSSKHARAVKARRRSKSKHPKKISSKPRKVVVLRIKGAVHLAMK